MSHSSATIPADVPRNMRKEYLKNYGEITRGTERLFLFAADQKLEHLNSDFVDPDFDSSINNPEHLFKIAQNGSIGAMATQLGLISRYGLAYPNVPYIAKLNGKTNLIPTDQNDPMSSLLWTTEDVIELKQQTKINLCGIGLTVYLGSDYEGRMLSAAAQEIFEAHQQGLVTILWVYPRGKAVSNPHNADLIAGAAGVAASLGADFVKVTAPDAADSETSAQLLRQAVQAAGNTRVIVAGGPRTDEYQLLETVYQQIHVGGAAGCAIGRNIFQHTVPEARVLTQALSGLVYDDQSVDKASGFLGR